MPNPFHRSMRSIEADRPGFALWVLGACAAVALAWGAWAGLGRVSIYRVASSARVESTGALYPVEAAEAGRVVKSELVLARAVDAGEVLVELDATSQRLQLEQRQGQAGALEAQIALGEQQLSQEKAALAESERLESAAGSEAAAQERSLEVRLETARRRLAALQASQVEIVAPIEMKDAEASVRSLEIEAERLRASAQRGGSERALVRRDQQLRVTALERDVARLRGELAAAKLDVARLREEIERRLVRAPVAGRLGDATELAPGGYVRQGQRLAVVTGGGPLRVVAQLPAEAAGVVREGQAAHLRLPGFPWAQYGVFDATVTRVATEAPTGLLRVELGVDPKLASSAPLRHGVAAAVEIEVDRVSPALLLLRTITRATDAPPAP